jgi:peptide/nickel transport system permease protein
MSDSAAARPAGAAAAQGFLGRARRSPTLIAGVVMVGLLVLVAVLAPWLSTHDPNQQNLTHGLLAPSSEHLFGTDQLGRDIFSRVLYAASTDLRIAVLAAILPFLTGVLLGLISGFSGGWLDYGTGRIVDTIIAFPFYVIIVSIVFAVGAGEAGIFVAFAIVGWVGYARVVRSTTKSMRSSGWVIAAIGGGLSDRRVILRHILPNALPQAIVMLMTEIVLIMVAIVTLGYLGLGVQRPTPDWGTMIADGQPFVTTKWWISALPGLAVIYTGIALSLVGDGLADAWRVK